MTFELVTLGILLILSAFFSATEVAFVSLSDAKVESMVKRKMPRSRLVRILKDNPRKLLVTILIGNNIVNVGAASLATVVVASFFDSAVIGITTGLMTLLILVFGEVLPKAYASNHPKRFAILSAPILYILEFIGWPVIIIFEKMTNLFAGKQRPDKVNEEELKALAQAGKKQGTIEGDEAHIVNRVFEMNDITAEDVMTPRVRVVTLESDISIEVAADIIAKNPHTRFPVIEDTIDNIIGFVHSRDVLLAFNEDKEKWSIKKIIRPIVQVPKQMRLDDLLREFQKAKTHMAVVMDEYAGTEGVATLEDVIEELVGEIADEHDVEEEVIKRIDKNTILVSGETEVREVNSFLNIQLPGDKFHTMAELMLDHLQKVPKKDMKVDFEGVVCSIEKMNKKVIDRVKIIKK